MRLIQKYLSKECTPEELEELKVFLDTPEGKMEWERYTAGLWDATSTSPSLNRRDAEASLRNILSKVKGEEKAAVRKVVSIRRGLIYVAAASVLVIIAAAVFFDMQPEEWHKQVTAYGERKRIALPDGSTVFLNGHSTVRYEGAWSPTKAREIWLDGEGFFDVVHSPGNERFIVHLSDQSQISVLGTAFNVHQGIKGTEVVLQRGKIEWRPQGGRPVVMLPGNKLNYSKTKDIVFEKDVPPQKYSSWKDGFIVLDGLTLKEVTVRLQDIYGWTFHFENDTLGRQQLWGSLPMDDPNLILKGLAQVTGAQVTEHDHRVTISSQ